MFSEPLWEVRGQRFQGPVLAILPEGFGGPETKHVNILSNADGLYQPQGSSGVCVHF